MLDLLRKYLSRFIEFGEDEFAGISQFLEVRHYKAKEQLTKIGEVDQYLNFIFKGVIRRYFLQGKEEIVTHFTKEGDLICSPVSFFSQSKSFYIIEAIEDCTVVSISRDNLEKMFSSSNRFERLGRLVIIEWLVQQCEWENARVRLSPKERFLYFVKKQPQLVRRVPQKQLASFLSIKPETFSRYKHFITAQDSL